MVPGSETSFVDAAIRAVTKSKYSHCAVLVRSGGPEIVYEVTRHGMCVIPLESYAPAYEEWSVRKPYSKTEEDYAISLLNELLASKVTYGYLEIVGMYLTLFLNRFIPVSRNLLDSRRTYICSELVGKVLRRLGSTLQKDPALMNPQDLVVSGTIDPVQRRGV
jgi:hypothetical protein